ncbi:hypothetical protein [Dyella caseinilytica]|uniref:Uncharacterized protein n=1 Tax=Dyella caseinilytica TaxID=1849581 RepID=A0ABX7GPV1_9GAMM|nr:hypothetical protein [Dyella caseinilytica]QRN52459.1 hypothetical protein ISN74_13350 [Dyella caseinilytica]GGA06216.1 hypothetical protein GCM10011408_28930 [Dyella caseinilytica]
MDLANKTDFFQQAYVRQGLFLLLGLLAGCGHAARKTIPTAAPAAPQVVDIGVPACNAYLNRYLACHRAAHVFSGDVLENHYQSMLSSLRQSASDPLVRPYLASRCIGMTQQLDAALQGRPCTATAASLATASSAPVSTQH